MSDELVVIEEGKALVFFTGGGLEPFLTEVKTMVDTFDHDMTTKKGRDKTRSFARKIATFKGKVEDSGKELVADWKKQSKAVDESRKHSRDTLDDLRDRARQPLTDWENAEKAREQKHLDAIGAMKDLINTEHETSQEYAANLAKVKAIEMGKCWEEFAADAAEAKDDVIEFLEREHGAAIKREEEAAELVRLRKEAEETKQRERDAAIARAAREQAEREAEENASRIAAEQQAEIERKEREAAEATARAEIAERERIAAEERAKIEAEEAKTRAIEAEARAEVERELAVKRAKEDAEVAQRAKEIAEEEAQRKREENKRNQNKKHKEAREGFVAAGFSEGEARDIVAAIVAGIPNVSINY